MKWNYILIMTAIIGWWSLCYYYQNKYAYYNGMYERLNGDVQAVFGNERPSEESLANVKDLIKSAHEMNDENRYLRQQTIMLKHHIETMDADKKEVMSHLIKARQENRLLQTEIELLRVKMN